MPRLWLCYVSQDVRRALPPTANHPIPGATEALADLQQIIPRPTKTSTRRSKRRIIEYWVAMAN
eukprot:7981199-Pyramimonas_sp.AAC.1